MTPLLERLREDGPVLIAAAAPVESRAVIAGLAPGHEAALAIAVRDWQPVELVPRVWLVQTGVGKVNAAGAVLEALRELPAATLLNIGICGALPPATGDQAGAGKVPVPLGCVICASHSVYADEGVETPRGFQSMLRLGFPLGSFGDGGVAAAGGVLEVITSLGIADRIGPIATVSTCSGTNARAAEVVQRTSALAEAMEGAAIAHALERLRHDRKKETTPAFAELRVVSNTTGDRTTQVWDLNGALARLTSLLAS